jgi:DNA polymerase III delta prime subunit
MKITNENNTLWVEKYRPQTLDSYIGNAQLKEKVQVCLESGDLPHLLLYGKAGTGKTTLAKLLVNNIDCEYLYINASDERNLDMVRDKVKTFAGTLGFSDLKVIILDECDYITPTAQAALRNLMETYSNHCRFILTCNFVERIIDPIQSRCQSYNLTPPSKKEVAVHLGEVLDTENVKYETKDVVFIINSCYPDIRRVINSAQKQSIKGKLELDKTSIVQNDYKMKVLEILTQQDKRSAFKNVRKLLLDSEVKDYTELFRLLYDEVDDWGKGHVAECILILAEYQMSDSQVVDKEINAMAMLTKLLGTIK